MALANLLAECIRDSVTSCKSFLLPVHKKRQVCVCGIGMCFFFVKVAKVHTLHVCVFVKLIVIFDEFLILLKTRQVLDKYR